jgi:hypothetical protein
MIKAVNIKGYRFGKLGNRSYGRGFAMVDTERDEFVSWDGKTPYVLESKKLIQSCINAGWPATMKRCTHA